MILRTTALVSASARVASAALPSVGAPGDEFSLLGSRFRVVTTTVDGWAAVAVRGFRAFRLDVALTPAPEGTVITCSATWRAVGGMLTRRTRVPAVLTSIVERVRSRAEELAAAKVVVGTAIVRDRAVLAQQRAYPPEAAGMWELPGGRVEPGETDEQAVRRECREELGVDVQVGAAIGPDVVVGDGRYLLRIYLATMTGGEPHPHDHADLRWLTAGRLGSVPWLPADRVLLPALRQALRGQDT